MTLLEERDRLAAVFARCFSCSGPRLDYFVTDRTKAITDALGPYTHRPGWMTTYDVPGEGFRAVLAMDAEGVGVTLRDPYGSAIVTPERLGLLYRVAVTTSRVYGPVVAGGEHVGARRVRSIVEWALVRPALAETLVALPTALGIPGSRWLDAAVDAVDGSGWRP